MTHLSPAVDGRQKAPFDARGNSERRNVFTYKLFTQDGDELGEATYLTMIGPGEEIHIARGLRYLVRKVVLFSDYESSYIGLLEVEPAR